MTLYEAIKTYGGMDICDNVFDYGVYFDFNEPALSPYDSCMQAMAQRIEFVSYKPTYYSPCKIADFISKNYLALNQLRREFLVDPEIKEASELQTIEDFYTNYIEMFNQLIYGSWPEKAYKRLVVLLDDPTSLEKVTVPEILSKFGITQSTLAQRMEVSDGLISKIKTGASSITEEVQEKFQSVFKGYILVNATYKAIDIIRQIQDLEKQSTKLDEDYAKAKQEVQNKRAILIGKLNGAAKEVSIKEDEE